MVVKKAELQTHACHASGYALSSALCYSTPNVYIIAPIRNS